MPPVATSPAKASKSFYAAWGVLLEYILFPATPTADGTRLV